MDAFPLYVVSLVTRDLFNRQELLLWIPPLLYIVSLVTRDHYGCLPPSTSCLLLVTRDLFNRQEMLWIPPSSTSCLLLVMRDRYLMDKNCYGYLPPFYVVSLTWVGHLPS